MLVTTHRRCIRAPSMSRLLFAHLFLFYSQHTHTRTLFLISLFLLLLPFLLARIRSSSSSHTSHPSFFFASTLPFFFCVFSHIKTKIKNASHASLWTPFSFFNSLCSFFFYCTLSPFTYGERHLLYCSFLLLYFMLLFCDCVCFSLFPTERCFFFFCY